ncbi:MAG: hypothetical protein JOZ56_09940 [Actinobacteria bacterium]|nr:hypothetical protein [Actinomycetota bacterium]MBV8563399.1 hypothetical protein [Actinomycetota bacterium]
MPSAVERLPVPQRLLIAAALSAAAVFWLLLEYGRPGLGISQGFYVPIILTAAATGPLIGALAGVGALFLWELAVREAVVWSAFTTGPALTRLVTFMAAGLIAGFLASRGRQMLAQALTVLDDLLHLANRDPETGISTTTGFEAAVRERLRREQPFVLLLADVAGGRELRPFVRAAGVSEIARVTPTCCAGVVDGADGEEHVAALRDRGWSARVGWAAHPEDGEDLLALYAAASERLHGGRATMVPSGA